MWYMSYGGDEKEFTTKKELENAIAEIMDDESDDELNDITVIEGEKCTLSLTRVLPAISVSSPVKEKAVVKNAKKK